VRSRLPAPPSTNELLVQVLHTRSRSTSVPPPENPLVLLMTPLDEERVRLFASAKGRPIWTRSSHKSRREISGGLHGGRLISIGSLTSGAIADASVRSRKCFKAACQRGCWRPTTTGRVRTHWMRPEPARA